MENRTEVIIVQHPRERLHPFGTARISALALKHCRLVVDHLGRLRRDPSLLGPLDAAALLYPAPGAVPVGEVAPAGRPRRLVVIDGTWHHARTLYRDIAPLRQLPHLTLPDNLRSAFQIRRQPRPYCLSTVEAIAYALRALEPGLVGLDALLASFDLMQDKQLAMPRSEGRQRARKRRDRPSRAIPRALVERFADLVVAYAESVAGATPAEPRRLLSLSAERPATGERFHATAFHPALSDAHLGYLGLDRSEVEAGLDPSQLVERFRVFAGDAILAGWNRTSFDLIEAAGFAVREGVLLKSAYHNLKRHRGSLDAVVAAEGLASGEPPRRRSERRLDNALRLARFLNARASSAQ